MAANPLVAIAEEFAGPPVKQEDFTRPPLPDKPIPQPEDAIIADAVLAWSRLPRSDRDAASQSVTLRQWYVLLAFSRRRASLAVREEREELIFQGLLAVGLDGWRYDFRDCIVRLALLYDAAVRIGVAPEEVFERAATLLPPRSAAELRSFLLRAPEDRSLWVMGYKAGSDEDGFRYVSFPWSEFKNNREAVARAAAGLKVAAGNETSRIPQAKH